MKMKGKPDIDDMKNNVDQYLGGASADSPPPAPTVEPATPRPASRITKTIRLAVDLEAAIKEAAHARWKESGRKISESDIIEEALRKYLNI